jgi:hypothetical protein
MNQDTIDLLRPESDTHKRLLQYVLDRLKLSEDKMRGFYPRWQSNERRLQAYITLKDYEQIIAQEKNDAGRSPVPVDVVVPYTYATATTANTYLLHTFMGREPIFQVSSNSAEKQQNAHNMETKLQYDCYHNRFAKHFWQFGLDQFIYGFGALRCDWQIKQSFRSKKLNNAFPNMFQQILNQNEVPPVTRELKTVYEGNEICALDPFMFFPDPRVPMREVSRNGEFVFWRTTVAKHKLKIGEARGDYAYVNAVGNLQSSRDDTGNSESSRDLLSQGGQETGRYSNDRSNIDGHVQLDEGTCYIVPADFGLGVETEPKIWFFTIGNKKQIIQAEAYDFDHDLHPVVVAEPDAIGLSFGSPSMCDFAGPLQDVASWFVNSHIRNTNKVIHNQLVVDPAMVEMQDLKKGGEARIIRLKQAAFGQDVRMALNQLQVNDVTRTHMQDMQQFIRMADMITGVNDNLRATQNAGGRKTATEVRTAGESGASRLAARSQLVSSHAMIDLAMMMSLNNMQFLSNEFSFHVLGQDGLRAPITLQPEEIVGDFYYPANDGTLPLDRVALLDVWQQIFQVVVADQNLGMAFNIPKMFMFIAKLGGAKNVEEFLMNPQAAQQPQQMLPMPDGQVDQMAQAGNIVPMSALPGGNGVDGNPGGRMAGGL